MKKLILLGLITFIIALLWQAPATLLATTLEQNNPGLRIKGISGRFWNGSAEQVTYQQTPLGKATWTINPLGLLMASFKGHLTLHSTDFNLDGDFVAGMKGSLSLTDTQFDASGAWINRLQNYTRLGGTFRGSIIELDSTPSNPAEPPLINGTLNWEQGSIKSPINLPEGNYQLVITPDSDGKLTGKLASNKAPLDLKGTLTLDKTWKYTTDVKVKATPKGKALRGLLSMAGKKSPDGSIHLKQTGSLSYLLPRTPVKQ
jgi:general secretion pathway protein N